MRGYLEKEALELMLKDEINRIKWILGKLKFKEPERYKIRKEFLKKFIKDEKIPFLPEDHQDEVFFWVNENILFLNPVIGEVKPQGKLTKKAIEKILF